MVSLSDTELSAVMDAARPIPPRSRDQFLCEVASELAKHDELGPGLVGRVVRDLQPRFLVAPVFMASGNRSPRSRIEARDVDHVAQRDRRFPRARYADGGAGAGVIAVLSAYRLRIIRSRVTSAGNSTKEPTRQNRLLLTRRFLVFGLPNGLNRGI